MKKNWPYYLIILLVLGLLFRLSQKASERQVNWEDDFTGASKSPFGCAVLMDYLQDLQTNDVKTVDVTVYQHLGQKTFTGYNYVFINNAFDPTKQDVDQLCSFVYGGNTAFISARDFGAIGDTLKCATSDALFFNLEKDSAKTLGAALKSGHATAEANVVNPSLHLPHNAAFDKTRYTVAFNEVDTAHTTVLGVDGKGNVNFIRVKFGKGQFYLHTLPDAFGNYYAADRGTSAYLFRVLSYLPDQPTFFDEHYKAGRLENHDIRRYVLSEPALHMAYMVLVITGLIALFFGGKRRQRPVPVVKPLKNSTLDFVEQVGTLYYRQGNHTDIVRKKINYFLESVRSRFYVHTNLFDERFVERVTSLSAVPKEQVQHLFSTIDYLRQTPSCGEKDLKNIENLIWEFNQRSKR